MSERAVYGRNFNYDIEGEIEQPVTIQRSPGKRTLTSQLTAPAHLFVQRKASGAVGTTSPVDVAVQATSGAGTRLPFYDLIQQSFGRHSVGNIRAHEGDATREGATKLGARAFAVGDAVGFVSSPDLHTAAHEAAHVIQQRGGVSLKGGIGEEGDTHEQHADAVADLVVQGKSAEGLLDQYASGTSQGPSVQRKGAPIKVIVNTPVKPAEPIKFTAATYKELYAAVKERADSGLEAGDVTREWSADIDVENETGRTAKFDLPLVLKLPTWTKYADQPAEDKHKYDTWAASIKAHENLHISAFQTGYAKLKTAVVGPTNDCCEKQATAVDETVSAAQADVDAKNQPAELAIPGGTEQVNSTP